jgi:FkbM family methyltransferase
MDYVNRRDFSFGAPGKSWEDIYIRWWGMKPMFVKPGALIIEVGTNIGEDIEGFLKVCNDCFYETFEPIEDFTNKVQAKWGNVSRLKVHKFGLAETDKNLTLCVGGGATADPSRFEAGECRPVTLMVKDAVREVKVVMAKHNRVTPRSVEIFHLNCEGCEYEVLESLIKADMLQYFKNVQLSAHFMEKDTVKVKESMARMCKIRETLSRTHHNTYLYLTPNGNSNWENWRMDGEPDA